MGGRVYGKYSRRAGMLADTNIELLARDGRLTMLVHRPVVARMDVYITADHNNTLCVGRGRIMGGVESEAENRGKRMLVVNKLADMGSQHEKNELIKFPGAFLNKVYRYFSCASVESYDDQRKHLMSHGDISIDEVIVPFITIREEVRSGENGWIHENHQDT